MIEVLLSERIRKTADKLPPDLREKASQAISKLPQLLATFINTAAEGFANSPGVPMKSACICNGAWFLFMMEHP